MAVFVLLEKAETAHEDKNGEMKPDMDYNSYCQECFIKAQEEE